MKEGFPWVKVSTGHVEKTRVTSRLERDLHPRAPGAHIAELVCDQVDALNVPRVSQLLGFSRLFFFHLSELAR